MVMHEVKPGWTITKEWEGYTIDADVAFSDIKEEEYAGIKFIGKTEVVKKKVLQYSARRKKKF